MSSTAPATHIFDTGPLSALAEAGWLGALRGISERDNWRIVIPQEVQDELKEGVHLHPSNDLVLQADWIELIPLESLETLVLLTRFKERMDAQDGRNLGECAVLALAKSHSWTAVIDDRVAREVAKEEGITVVGTLRILLDAVRMGYLTRDQVSDMADHLIRTGYRLPFLPGEFLPWAEEYGLLS